MSGSKRVNGDKLAIRRQRMKADTSLVVHHLVAASLVVHHRVVANLMVEQWWMGINVVVQGRAVHSQSVEGGLDRRLEVVFVLLGMINY